jgi:hypothetical protein
VSHGSRGPVIIDTGVFGARLGIPLVTHDAIFAKVKDLTLLTKLGM